MSTVDVTRAWKDPEYRSSLSPAELAAVPGSPVGAVELTDTDLADVDAGSLTTITTTIAITWEAGCFTFNGTYCNGTCAMGGTVGCCG